LRIFFRLVVARIAVSAAYCATIIFAA
jgi:hypothetical protein